MKDVIMVPPQTCILHLAGGYVQREGDAASPVFHGRIETGLRQIMVEVRTEPGDLYDRRGLVDIDGVPAFG